MKHFSYLLFAVLVILLPRTAHADWIAVGAATRCDQVGMTFTIVPTVETSDRASNYNAPRYFSVLSIGPDQTYNCNLSNAKVRLKIRVYPPQPRGMGQGAGVIIISSLTINGKNVIRESNFNWQVMPEDRVLTKVIVAKRDDSLTSTLCYSDGWNWDAPYKHLSCEISRVGR